MLTIKNFPNTSQLGGVLNSDRRQTGRKKAGINIAPCPQVNGQSEPALILAQILLLINNYTSSCLLRIVRACYVKSKCRTAICGKPAALFPTVGSSRFLHRTQIRSGISMYLKCRQMVILFSTTILMQSEETYAILYCNNTERLTQNTSSFYTLCN